jgi:hypothetical protein
MSRASLFNKSIWCFGFLGERQVVFTAFYLHVVLQKLNNIVKKTAFKLFCPKETKQNRRIEIS